MSVTSTEFVTAGGGQYTSTFNLDPSKLGDIQVRMKPNQIGDFKVEGSIVYYYGDDKSKSEYCVQNIPINVRKESGTAQKENAPLQQQTPGFDAIIGLIGLLFAIFLKKRERKEVNSHDAY
jgi:hypothetical protein